MCGCEPLTEGIQTPRQCPAQPVLQFSDCRHCRAWPAAVPNERAPRCAAHSSLTNARGPPLLCKLPRAVAAQVQSAPGVDLASGTRPASQRSRHGTNCFPVRDISGCRLFPPGPRPPHHRRPHHGPGPRLREALVDVEYHGAERGPHHLINEELDRNGRGGSGRFGQDVLPGKGGQQWEANVAARLAGEPYLAR